MAREIWSDKELEAVERFKNRPKSIKCKTPKCPGKMHYLDNVYRVRSGEWHERFSCYRCEGKYVKGESNA